MDLLRREVSTVQPAFDEGGADEFAERVGIRTGPAPGCHPGTMDEALRC